MGVNAKRPRMGAAWFRGANERTRTADLRITNALLYQLSHVGVVLLAKRNRSIANRPAARKEQRGVVPHGADTAIAAPGGDAFVPLDGKIARFGILVSVLVR